MSLLPFEAANDIGDRFLSMLEKYGITPPIGSGLEDELLSLTRLIEVWKDPSLASGSNSVDILRSAAGFYDLAAKVLTVEPLPDFSDFIDHLQLIGATKVRVASLGQNRASGPDDDTARKVAELYIGCLAAHVGTDVVLDSPTNSQGDNPDVMFTVQVQDEAQPPQRWAIAIKTISSRQGQTIFERIAEGAAQIDAPKCQADKGMVFINTKSALDHDALWNREFADKEEAINALKEQLQGLIESANENRPQGEWDALFTKKVVRPVIFMGQTLVRLPTSFSECTPTVLNMLMIYDANGAVDQVGSSLASVMNKFMQTVRLGIPGGQNFLPR